MMTYFKWMDKKIICEEETFRLRLKKEESCEKSEVVYLVRGNKMGKGPRVKKL